MPKGHKNYPKHQYGMRQAVWGTDEQEDQQPDQHPQPSEAGSSWHDTWHRPRTVDRTAVQTQDIWKVPPTVEDWEQEEKVATFAGGLPPTTRSSQEWEPSVFVPRQEEAAATYSSAQSDADPLVEGEENETPAGYHGYYLDQFGYPQTPTLESWYGPYEGPQYNTPQQVLSYSQPQDQYAAAYTYLVPVYPQQQLVTDPKPQDQYAATYSPVVPVYPQQQLVTDPKPQDQYAAAYSSVVQGLQGLLPRRHQSQEKVAPDAGEVQWPQGLGPRRQQRQEDVAADEGEVQWPQGLRPRRQQRQENVAADEGEMQWPQGLRSRRQQRQENLAADEGDVHWPRGSPPTRQSRQENEAADASEHLTLVRPRLPERTDAHHPRKAIFEVAMSELVDFLLELENMKEPLDEALAEAGYLDQDPLWMVSTSELEYAVQRHLYSVAVLRKLIAQREAVSSRSWRNTSMMFGSSSVTSGSAVAGASAVAGDTGVASVSSVASDTSVASGSAVAGDTGVASGSSVTSDTSVASDSAVAGDTGEASGSAVAGDTGVASGLAVGRGWVARGGRRGVGRASTSRPGRGGHVGKRFTLMDLRLISPKTKTA